MKNRNFKKLSSATKQPTQRENGQVLIGMGGGGVGGSLCTARALRATFRLCSPPKSPQANPLEMPLELGDPNCPSSRKLQTTFPSHNTHHAQLEKP